MMSATMLVLEFESHGAEIHEKRKDQDMARLQKKNGSQPFLFEGS